MKREDLKSLFFELHHKEFLKNKEYYDDQDIEIFNERLEPFKQLFDEIDDKDLEKKQSPEKRVVDEDSLFGDISTTIKILSDYQKEGFIEFVQVWDGYEDNHFEARKPALECDEEWYERIKEILDKRYYWWRKKQDTIRLKKERIAQMEKELEKLKAEL